MKRLDFILGMLFLTQVVLAQSPQAPAMTALSSESYTNEAIGVSLRLPNLDWKLMDQSQGPAKVLVFSPGQGMIPRTSVLYLPAAIYPEGMNSREKQVQTLLGSMYKKAAGGTEVIDGKEFSKLAYEAMGTTTIEYGLKDNDSFLIFQLCGSDKDWQDAATKAALDGIKASFKFSGKTPEKK
jgi:hypothetical protein